jgi:hypothetical protein
VGAAKTALLIGVATAHVAAADPCTGSSAWGRFATCFDPGNRLSLTAATDGFGGAIAVRHEIHFEDEPDLVWKLEHRVADTTYDGFTDRFDGTLYRGRFLRHMRDGHIVFPLTGAKINTYSDIGALFEVGHLEWKGMDPASLGIVKTALLVDVSRSRDFRRRIAFGPQASWDVGLAGRQASIADHRVTPFSALRVELHQESNDGLWVFDAHGEAGTTWQQSLGGWRRTVLGEASLERILLAINDRPIALYTLARYDSLRAETIAALGVRIVLFDRADPRVAKL